ncbi:MAG: serine/threonine-protein kinase [Gaiellaceae bacterium]
MTTGALVGKSFAGYRVERVLGRGGMSVVYLAEHPRLKSKVALKLLAPTLAEDDLFRERLLRESRLAASLNHPNVIPIFDTGEEDGVLFVSMRFVDGPDLRTLLRAGPLPREQAASVIGQAAAALDAAHARDLVHRDVKPANILTEASHVYVADFGLTKHTDARSGATASGVVGTVDYMPPEQIEGRQLDGRADVYALGCVLFECLTGRPPFQLDNEVAVLWAHIREDPPLPSEVDRSVPRAFDGIVDRALAKNPRDRYDSAGALAADVQQATQTKVRTRQVRLPRARTRSRRRWLVPALAGLLLGAAIATPIVLAIRGPAGASSSEATAADPSLMQVVPSSLQGRCVRADPPSPDFDASVACTPTATNVTSVRYSHARSGLRMKQHLQDQALSHHLVTQTSAGWATGSCSEPATASVRDWTQTGSRRAQLFPSTPGRPRGRLLCYASPYGWAAAEWTDQLNDVYAVAYGTNRYAVYRWWRVRSGA